MSLDGLYASPLKPDTSRAACVADMERHITSIRDTIVYLASVDVLDAAELGLIALVGTLSDRMHTGDLDTPEFDTLLMAVRAAQDALYDVYRQRGL